MSVSFFPTVPYPDEIGVNMTYSSFGEVRQILAGLIDKEFENLIKEAYSENFPSDFYTRYDKCCDRLKETVGEGFFELFNQSDCEGEMDKDACKDFIAAMKDKDLNEIKWDYRRGQVENMLKMMQIVVDSPKEDAVFKWW
ncbi:MAG: hypothetical protein IKN15_01745 [Bacteroidaceae bacterium]|nr:hypothetical protein [Bacteroidaceae bacterium]